MLYTPIFIVQGMVVTSIKAQPDVCQQFEATINLLFHQNCIKKGFQCTVHVGNVCQTAEILQMSTVSSSAYLYKTLTTMI